MQDQEFLALEAAVTKGEATKEQEAAYIVEKAKRNGKPEINSPKTANVIVLISNVELEDPDEGKPFYRIVGTTFNEQEITFVASVNLVTDWAKDKLQLDKVCNISYEKRIGGKTQYIDDAGKTQTHKGDSNSINKVSTSSKYKFDLDRKNFIAERDTTNFLGILESHGAEAMQAVASYRGLTYQHRV